MNHNEPTQQPESDPPPQPQGSEPGSPDGGLRFGALSPKEYWRKNIICVILLLCVWFAVSYACGIIYADALDAHRTPGGGVKLGFWFAQQGSIFAFVCLIAIYVIYMNRLDSKFRGEKP